jgi:hypothetical protein
LNPTGQPGDEVCPYSDCDEGGDHSAICACIDLKKYGMGEGTEWVCMHATCSCGEEQQEDNGIVVEELNDMSGAAAYAFFLPISIMALVVMFH